MFHEEMKQGAAAVRRWSKKNGEELWRRIKAEHPTHDYEDRLEQFKEIVRDDDDYYADVCRYATTNYEARIEKGITKRQRPRKRMQAAVDAIKKQIKAAVMADFICPNGKTIRNNTGGYLKELGSHFARIGEAVKPNQIVGKVLTDEQIQLLYLGKRA